MQLIGAQKRWNKRIEYPYYSELSVQRVYLIVKQHEILLKYLPDYHKNEFPNRSFFYGIVFTLFPNELTELIKKARSNRALSETQDKEELI